MAEPSRRLSLMLVLPLLLPAAGCNSDGRPRLISAQLLDDESPEATAPAGSAVIRLTLDRPLPPNFEPELVKAWSGPPRTKLLAKVVARTASSVHPSGQPAGEDEPLRILDLELLSTPPALKPDGSFTSEREGDGPTGIGVDLGPAAPGEQWVDLQEERRSPVLLQAVWEDRAPPGAERSEATSGNLIVDRGDRVRLVFDREVALRADEATGALDGSAGPRVRRRVANAQGPQGPLARVPEDILLTAPEDQLDDGAEPSYFLPGERPREVLIVLGRNPRLTIAGRHRSGADPAADGRGAPYWPSGIAVAGTAIQPMGRITDRQGTAGVISLGSVDIEFAGDYYFFEKRTDEAFPSPGSRTHHTVTPIAGGRAVIAGGRTPAGPVGQVLLYSPDSPRPFTVLGEKVEPRYLHTATLLPGDDGALHTFDDLLLLAGGTDGNRSLNTLEVVGPLDPSAPERIGVKPLTPGLSVPRMYHTAVFIPPDLLLIEGGLFSAPGAGGGIVAGAELFTLEMRGGTVTVRGPEQVPQLPRMRHTSLYLGPAADGSACLLTYGGLGKSRDPDATQRFFSPDDAVVLAAPMLTQLSRGGPGVPAPAGVRWRQETLDFEYRFEMLRFDHQAVPVGFQPYQVQGNAPREVLIAGGSLYPPNIDANRPLRILREEPRRSEDYLKWTREPTYTESAAALVLELRPDKPSESLLRVVESPSAGGDSRVHLALVPLGQPGVLILGGENPRQPQEVFATGEVYLPGERRLAPLAVPLAAPRTSFGAFTVEWPGATTVYLVGGSSPAKEGEALTDIERLKLGW